MPVCAGRTPQEVEICSGNTLSSRFVAGTRVYSCRDGGGTVIFWPRFACAVAAIAMLCLAFAPPSRQGETQRKRRVDFNRDVRPILSEHCFKCHGPSAKDVRGNLRLDDPKSATRDRGGYAVIVPGAPGKSRLWQRVSAPVPAAAMPPPDAGVKPLTEEDKRILRAWIEEGAEYKPHWSYIPPKKPALPEVSRPEWCSNDVDRFVLAKLDEKGLRPEPEADRATLIRRASLTLIGLPPTPAEIAEFERDSRPDAYERMVDRLLADPRYGEHQARYWLDAVRYGDTHGLHLDNERSIYPYRDWVVRAFNQDLPFDRFTTWQLAGDLLPNPTTEQKIATGYIRMNPTTNEGGAIEEEFQAKNTFDRVETTATVFLGITLTCARCHDHKYDPFTTKEYYSLFAFFNSTADKPLDGNELTPAPVMRARTPEQDAILAAWEKEAGEIAAQVDLDAAMTWLKTTRVELPSLRDWEVSKPYPADSFDAAFATEYGPEPGGMADSANWKRAEVAFGKPLQNLAGRDNAATFVRGVIESSQDRDVELSVTSDDGIKIWVNDTLVHENKVLRALGGSFDTVRLRLKEGPNAILFKIVNAGGGDGLQFSIGDKIAEKIDKVYKTLVNSPGDEAAIGAAKALYLEAGPESVPALRHRKLRADIDRLESMIPFTLVAEELPGPRPAYVLDRGEYSRPRDRVYRNIPKALGSWPKGAPMNRLGLARWLVAEENPLTARVFVNRIWQQHFGHGIVKTAEDFGSQGEWPSNLELLDYLAVTFVESGWSVKKLHKTLLMSSAFRQRATVSKAKLQVDPENRFVSRGPRFRLDAEVIRDQALYVSGLLNSAQGGKGFKPYQPSGLWEAIAFADSTTAKYVQDQGDTIYRRSLYLFWKRTSPPPAMMIFDAPMREACVVRRSRTNTPTQALVTLNEPAFIEAARTMAERVIRHAKHDPERMDFAFRLALGRPAHGTEFGLLMNALNRYLKLYSADEEGALQIVSIGERQRDKTIPVAQLAAWSLICSTLMNTDEFLTQH